MGFWTATEKENAATKRRKEQEAQAREARQRQLKALRKAIKQRHQ